MKKFLEAKESPYYMALFRLMMAGFCLNYVFVTRHSVLDLFGEHGFTGWGLSRTKLYNHLPHISDIPSLLNIGADSTVYLLYIVFATALVFLFAGLFTRIAAVICWVISFFLLYAGIGTINGMNMLAHVGLFYLCLMPSNRALALDVYLFKNLRGKEVKSYMRRVLQIHVAILYASSGLEKAAGGQWWNGEAIYRAMNMPIHNIYDMMWLANYPKTMTAIGISILIIEVGYFFFVWVKKLRVWWVALTILMHIGIGVFLNLGQFATMMILLNLGAFGPEIYSDLVRRKRALVKQPVTVPEGEPWTVVQGAKIAEEEKI